MEEVTLIFSFFWNIVIKIISDFFTRRVLRSEIEPRDGFKNLQTVMIRFPVIDGYCIRIHINEYGSVHVHI